MAKQGRRPPYLNETKANAMIEKAERGATWKGIARAGGINESTIHKYKQQYREDSYDGEWEEEFEDFMESLNRARSQGEHCRLKEASDEFILERSYGYTKSIEQDVQLSGDPDGEPVKVLGFDPAGYPTEEDEEGDEGG